MKTGLVSVTFRQLAPKEIIVLCRKAGLEGIEWGTDVHLQNPQIAAEVKAEMEDLAVLSLGSYYRIGQGENFREVLQIAKAIGAPNIRIWAGSLEAEEISPSGWQKAVLDARQAADQAAAQGMTVSFEYHRRTLTANQRSAVQLLEEIDRENLKIYWQPLDARPQQQYLSEIQQLGRMGKLLNLHLYSWRGEERYPLAHDAALWEARLQAAMPYAHAALLEFVAGDAPQQFLQDAAWLKQIVFQLSQKRSSVPE
jgi:sugar phosphate isomerase/epimerase